MTDDGGDWAEDHAERMGLCTYCPKLCRHACPVAEAERSETSTPWWKTTVAALAASGARPLSEAADLAYRCTGCRLEEEVCLHDNRLPPLYHDVRAAAIEEGVAPPRARSFAARMRELGNPFRADLVDEVRTTEPGAHPGATLALVVDCVTLRHEPESIGPLARLLQRVAGEPVAIRTFPGGCCGYPHHLIGDREAFREAARETADALSDLRRAVCPSPSCVVCVRETFREVGVVPSFGIEPLVTFLGGAKRLLREAETSSLDVGLGPVSYHDACYLGRYLGDYDGPRAILEALGGDMEEMSWNREKAWCSGGGGCYAKLHPEAAEEMARKILADPGVADGRPVAAGCPSCRRMLRRVSSEERILDPSLQVAKALDLT